MPRNTYIWVRVPPEIYDAWVNELPRKVKHEISNKVTDIIKQYVGDGK